jgi:hypothetical protein
VIIPVIRFAGVTSNAGFQQLIPVNIPRHAVFSASTLTCTHGRDEKCVQLENPKGKDHLEDLIVNGRIIVT